MRHAFRLPEPGSPEITVDNDLLTGLKVFVDGQRQPRLRERGRPAWAVTLADGSIRRLSFAGTMTGLRAVVDGKRIIELERRLALWELVLAFLPIGLVGVGGLIGGIVGAVGVVLNLGVVRRPWPIPARIAAALAVFGLAAVAWFAIVTAVRLAAGS